MPTLLPLQAVCDPQVYQGHTHHHHIDAHTRRTNTSDVYEPYRICSHGGKKGRGAYYRRLKAPRWHANIKLVNCESEA